MIVVIVVGKNVGDGREKDTGDGVKARIHNPC
jgi:hypothetical protein